MQKDKNGEGASHVLPVFYITDRSLFLSAYSLIADFVFFGKVDVGLVDFNIIT